MITFVGWSGPFRPRSCSVITKEWYTCSYNRQGTITQARRTRCWSTSKCTYRFPIDILASQFFLQPRSLELHHILGTIPDVLSTGKPAHNWHLKVHDLSDIQKPPKINPLPSFVESKIHTPYVRYYLSCSLVLTDQVTDQHYLVRATTP
jgi:hypothetical protein